MRRTAARTGALRRVALRRVGFAAAFRATAFRTVAFLTLAFLTLAFLVAVVRDAAGVVAVASPVPPLVVVEAVVLVLVFDPAKAGEQ